MANLSNISTILDDLEPESSEEVIVEIDQVPSSHSNVELGSATESENALSIHVFANEDHHFQDAQVVLATPYERENEPNEPETDPSLLRTPHDAVPRPFQRGQNNLYDIVVRRMGQDIDSLHQRMIDLEAQFEEMNAHGARRRLLGLPRRTLLILMGWPLLVIVIAKFFTSRRTE